jgi:O-acetyl-ADP-ribose deacetylase (regulator of RNase III)
MLTIITGDLFTSDAQALINPVNLAGVMGKGVALTMKQRFGAPLMAAYHEQIRTGRLKLGRPALWRNTSGPHILNFATKDDWRQPSKLEWIEAALDYLARNAERAGITSIATPMLGTGLGGLPQREVLTLIHDILHPISVPVTLYRK